MNRVALLGRDYTGLKPAMEVLEGDHVRLGQKLFADKRNPAVAFGAPAAGVVSAIHRGPRRVLQSIVIEVDGEQERHFEPVAPDKLNGENLRARLLDAGLWPAFRMRPFGTIPSPEKVPFAIFVPAMDSNPLAADAAVIIQADSESFAAGLVALTHLTDGNVHVCTAPAAGIAIPEHPRIVPSEFAGPHPAGLVGTHIHFLAPVSLKRSVWHLDYQDVIAIGHLLSEGRLTTDRVVAVGGPMVDRPRLLRTRLGASTRDLLDGEVTPGAARVVSGSVLSGHRASEWAAYLGRYHSQITVLPEGGAREFLGWALPGFKKYSAIRAYAGHLTRRRFTLNTLLNGSPRAMVPIDNYEKVMPLDILPTPLLKALLVGDADNAQALGCLELDEEDLALCSFVCPGKYEYGPYLREMLTEIEGNT